MLKRFTARERQFAKMSEYIAISPAISIMHQCDFVLDTAAMVAAIRSDAGASRRLLVAALEQRFTLLISEYEAVMTRAQHLVASKLSAQDVGILLDAVASVGEPVRPAFLWRPSLRDADDDMVLEVAVNGQADAIVTFNRRDFRT